MWQETQKVRAGESLIPSSFPLVQPNRPHPLLRLQHTCTLLDTSAYLEDYPALDFVSHFPDMDRDYETENAEVRVDLPSESPLQQTHDLNASIAC
jgi:hypothetical protein